MLRLITTIILGAVLVCISGATINIPSVYIQYASTSNVNNNDQRRDWCSFPNGTTVPLGFSFMESPCTVCTCVDSRMIRCSKSQCMPTYCIDDATPVIRPEQCCGQCSYERVAVTCIYNGAIVPHGTVIKTTNDKATCWCQYGNIECRKAWASASGMDVWGDGTAVYVVVIIVCGMLILATVICCACIGFFYFYYKRNQQNFSQVYEQYWNNAGWQPMSEEEQAAHDAAKEKRAEAEYPQTQNDFSFGNHLPEHVPPPYAVYNASYAHDEPVRQ